MVYEILLAVMVVGWTVTCVVARYRAWTDRRQVQRDWETDKWFWL